MRVWNLADARIPRWNAGLNRSRLFASIIKTKWWGSDGRRTLGSARSLAEDCHQHAVVEPLPYRANLAEANAKQRCLHERGLAGRVVICMTAPSRSTLFY